MDSMNNGNKNNKLIGNLLIVFGSICILYFVWVNYSGAIFQNIYLFIYDNFLSDSDTVDDNFFTYDDLPGFLKLGGNVFGTNDEPALSGSEANTLENINEEDDTPGLVKETLPIVDYTDRIHYSDNHMRILIPRMGVKALVKNGTSSSKLKAGPCLYDISDLPGEGDRNVLIAAHREGYSAWFYNIDKLKNGDKIALQFNGKKYIYEYENTIIVDKADWSVTEKKGYSVLTLTSCHPKGSNAQRIVVFARLVEISDN